MHTGSGSNQYQLDRPNRHASDRKAYARTSKISPFKEKKLSKTNAHKMFTTPTETKLDYID